MAENSSVTHELVFPEKLWRQLEAHLFRADGDEHGAILAAGVAKTDRFTRLLVRHVFLAKDGRDYVDGQRGYRMLTADFVRDHALLCRDEKLSYLAVHNHLGRDHVAFSTDDLASHERGYPALQDITRGQIVGGVVFARNAAAGDLWIGSQRIPLHRTRVIGANTIDMHPSVPARPFDADPKYDRQARLFGDRGQEVLRQQRVGIIGLGGIGSLVAEYLSRLGVGALVLVDPDRIEFSNLPRVAGSTRTDAWLRRQKVKIAAREAVRANRDIVVVQHASNVVDEHVARQLACCDYIVLAADSMQARLVFNAIVHQFLIPGVQLGAKVPVDPQTGEVGRVFSVIRPVIPGQNCLWCNGLIAADRLQEESLTVEERRRQRYVDDDDVPVPSVITLNAVAAAHAVNNYLFRTVGLRNSEANEDFVYIEPQSDSVRFDCPRRDDHCVECGESTGSRFARGDLWELPTKPGRIGRSRKNSWWVKT